MKKTMMIMAFLAVGMIANANEKNDTTVIENAKKVTIISSDTEQRIKVRGKEGNSTYYYENAITLRDSAYSRSVKVVDVEKSNWDFDLGFGLPIATNVPSGMSFAPFKSYEWILGFRYKYTPKKALQTYSVGLWANWRQYTLDTDKVFGKDANNVVGVYDYPINAGDKRSSIYVFGLSVPFLFTQKFGHKSGFKMSLGPVVNFNLYGRINSKYTLGDDEIEINTKGLEYRPITVDIMGMLQYMGIGFYCKYSPMSVLKKDMGPEFRSVSVGVFF